LNNERIGLVCATIVQEYGGMGLPASIYAKIVYESCLRWMAREYLIAPYSSRLQLNAAAHKLKRRFLHRMVTGEMRVALPLRAECWDLTSSQLETLAVRM